LGGLSGCAGGTGLRHLPDGRRRTTSLKQVEHKKSRLQKKRICAKKKEADMFVRTFEYTKKGKDPKEESVSKTKRTYLESSNREVWGSGSE
jgi:hypothetical protein